LVSAFFLKIDRLVKKLISVRSYREREIKYIDTIVIEIY